MSVRRNTWIWILLAIVLLGIIAIKFLFYTSTSTLKDKPEEKVSLVPDIKSLSSTPENDLIRYGRDLVANTAKYLGPHGSLAQTTNGLNCQNCHMEAGARPFANNFLAVKTTFPKWRPRSGKLETVEFRINECLERSLNGSALDSGSRELRAMTAYLKWIGSNVQKGSKNDAVGAMEMAFIDRAADPVKGHTIFRARCASCHGYDGQGVWSPDSNMYRYPPLWGEKSYAVSAGMFRNGKLASFIRNNMPVGATRQAPLLTNEECWDVAAYINSQPHPMKRFAYDWPDIKNKPVDYPFGPYADTFSEQRHKYGPYIGMK